MNDKIIYAGQFQQGTDRFIVPESSAPAVKPSSINEYIINSNNKRGNSLFPLAISGLAGAMIGSALSAKNQKQPLPLGTPKKEKPSLDGNYYSYVKNVIENLDVTFTPAGVIFTVKNGKTPFTLENIKVSEMNESMMEAFNSNNKDFFKNVMVTKMLSDVQLAERSFARRLLEKQANVFEKLAQIELNVVPNQESSLATINEFFKISSIVCKNEKVANIVFDGEQYDFSVDGLNRDFEKYAGIFSGVRKCLGFGEGKENFQKNLKKISDIGYLKRNLSIGYFPDRIVFSCENQLIDTLDLLDMNEEGFAKFKERDNVYFKDLFINEMKRNLGKLTNSFEKMAQDGEEGENPLCNSKSNPVELFDFMNENFEKEWLEFEMDTLDEVLKKHFDLEEIPETVLYKIFSIIALLKSNSFFENAYSFEKIVLGFSSKHMDMMNINQDNIAIENIIMSLEYVDAIIREDDIYDNFADEVLTYIAETFVKNGVYFYPMVDKELSKSQMEFYKIVNDKIVDFAEETTILSFHQLTIARIATMQIVDVINKYDIESAEAVEPIIKKIGYAVDKEKLLRRNIEILLSVREFMK